MLDNYEYLKEEFYNMTNINLNAYKERQMKRRIEAFIDRQNFSDKIDIKQYKVENKTPYRFFVKELKNDSELLDEFINHLTINVSEFFRNPQQWEELRDNIIPYLFDTFGRTLKIWSSACSTGDEPYSLVLLLSEFLPLSKIHIYASDVDDQVMEKAKLGIYNIKSLKEVPKKLLTKYFIKINENTYQISDEIKECVTFKKLDLLKDNYINKCNFIICRNVLIYFTEEAKDEIYKKFNESLVDNGILFVGSTEQIIHAQKYKLKSHKSFFYKKIGSI